ncbi:hypothetical protein B0T16DRAFT_440489 [Cercophora newfieldiana]|uniref:Uncharacterized protein n=1 Tax=Cercophora newfieldiana TaxID=92897 RepID=A0AA40CXG9_9PEZI|nr:hypothetical protein B0T16DRAFT_440489 [Cercophora newfieldiana]
MCNHLFSGPIIGENLLRLPSYPPTQKPVDDEFDDFGNLDDDFFDGTEDGGSGVHFELHPTTIAPQLPGNLIFHMSTYETDEVACEENTSDSDEAASTSARPLAEYVVHADKHGSDAANDSATLEQHIRSVISEVAQNLRKADTDEAAAKRRDDAADDLDTSAKAGLKLDGVDGNNLVGELSPTSTGVGRLCAINTINSPIRANDRNRKALEAFREMAQNWRDGIIASFGLPESRFRVIREGSTTSDTTEIVYKVPRLGDISEQDGQRDSLALKPVRFWLRF